MYRNIWNGWKNWISICDVKLSNLKGNKEENYICQEISPVMLILNVYI